MQTLITLWLSLLLSNHTTVRLIKYQVNPAQHEKFRKALSNYVAAALKTPGNIMAAAYYEEQAPADMEHLQHFWQANFDCLPDFKP